jgi:hypothetical protein
MSKRYQSDNREKNPNLHLLYVKWAARSLAEIDRCIKRIVDIGQVSSLSVVAAMHQERQRLVDTDAAYADADAIIKMMADPDYREEHESEVESEGSEEEGTQQATEGAGGSEAGDERGATFVTDGFVRARLKVKES